MLVFIIMMIILNMVKNDKKINCNSSLFNFQIRYINVNISVYPQYDFIAVLISV